MPSDVYAIHYIDVVTTFICTENQSSMEYPPQKTTENVEKFCFRNTLMQLAEVTQFCKQK
jgi:hypothetical protein